jgi:hypothetical protein
VFPPQLLHQFSGPIRGAVVHHDYARRGKPVAGRLQQRPDRRPHVVDLVETGHDDEGQHRMCCAASARDARQTFEHGT